MSDTSGKTALPRPSSLGPGEWSRRLRARRRDSMLIDRLDGGGVALPRTGAPCPRWCSAMSAADLEHWAAVGHCPCRPARDAVAS